MSSTIEISLGKLDLEDLSSVDRNRTNVDESEISDGVIDPISEEDGNDDEIEILFDTTVKKRNQGFPETEGWNVAYRTKSGYVKEMISDTLGMLFSMDSGPVLFNVRHLWLNGQRFDPSRDDQDNVYPGLHVDFIEVTVENQEFSILSSEGILKQAIAAWSTGDRPSHIFRLAIDQQHRDELALDRKVLVSHVRRHDFLSVDLVRVGATIRGYLTDDIGVMSARDASGQTRHVLFHSSDAYIFREHIDRRYRSLPPPDVVPVGLSVRVDARKLSEPVGCVTHQAVAVFAGSWPATPHPTLLPGGRGSFSPCYDIPRDATFYYLQLSKRSDLQEKVDKFEKLFRSHAARMEKLERRFLDHVPIIQDEEDKDLWRVNHAPPELRGRPKPNTSKKRNYHVFSTNPPQVPEYRPFGQPEVKEE